MKWKVMVIQHNNYEEYILDYLEGSLGEELVLEMDSFFNQNPHLLNEAIEIQHYKIPKTTFQLNDSIKSSLLKENSTKLKIIPYWKLGMAASFLVLLSFSSIFLYKQYNTQPLAAVISPTPKQIKPAKTQPIVIPLKKEKQIIQHELKIKQNEKQKTVLKTKSQVDIKTNKQATSLLKRETKSNTKIQKTIATANAVKPKTIKLNYTEKIKESNLSVENTQRIIPIKKINIRIEKPKYNINSSEVLTTKIAPKTLIEPKTVANTSERILAKNDSLKSIHKTSLHELFTELETKKKKEPKNHKFVKKTGKLLKSVFKLEEISPKDVKQAFIPKSIKIKKNK